MRSGSRPPIVPPTTHTTKSRAYVPGGFGDPTQLPSRFYLKQRAITLLLLGTRS